MTNDLHDLLHELGGEPESERIDMGEVLHQAQGRVRRRRVLVGAGVGVGAACVIASTFVVADLRSADGPLQPVGPQPSETTAQSQSTTTTTTAPTFHADVVTIDQARSAQLGRDYEAVAQQLPDGVTQPLDTDAEGDLLVRQQVVLGQVLLTRRVGVVPSGTTVPTWYDSPTGQDFTMFGQFGLSRDWVVFATTSGVSEPQADRVFVVNRSTGDAQQLIGTSFQAGGHTFAASDIGDLHVSDSGTVFVLAFDGGDPFLLSLPADGSGAPTLEGRVPGEIDVADDLLASVQNEPAVAAEITDVASGARTPVVLPVDQRADCAVSRIEAAAEHVGLVVDCQQPDGQPGGAAPLPRRFVDVYDAAGNPLWVVDLHSSDTPRSFTDEGMTWLPEDPSTGAPGPVYWFGFADGAFLRFDAYGVVPHGMVQAGDTLWVTDSPPDGQPAILRITSP